MVRDEPSFTSFPSCCYCCCCSSSLKTKAIAKATKEGRMVLEGVKEEGAVREGVMKEEVDGFPIPRRRIAAL